MPMHRLTALALSLVAFLAALPALAEWRAPSRPDAIAVIIGNRGYAAEGGGVPDVLYAHNDADAFRRFMIDVMGLREANILDYRDARAIDLLEIFGTERDHKGRLYYTVREGESEVYVFYSGHGVPDIRDTEATGYLLPVDARADRPTLGGYPLDLLLANLEKLPVPDVMVFLDACFSGLSQGGTLVRGVSAGFGVAVAAPKLKANVTVLAATAFDTPQYAHWLTEEEHGAFTYYTLEALYGAADHPLYGAADGRVSLSEVEAYLRREMSYRVRRSYFREQTPSLSRGAASERVLVASVDNSWPFFGDPPPAEVEEPPAPQVAAIEPAAAVPAEPDIVVVPGPVPGTLQQSSPVPEAGIDAPEEETGPTEATESVLGLNRSQRREVQRRLSLLGHDPRGIDGIFGPGTRGAITAWQKKQDLTATGYLDAAHLKALVEDSKTAYDRWRKQAARSTTTRRRSNARSQPAASEPAPAQPRRTGRYIDAAGCLREANGAIVPGFKPSCG